MPEETDASTPNGVETDAVVAEEQAPEESVAHRLVFDQQHLRLIQVEFRDQTDQHNELVHERCWLLHPSDKVLALQGNLFVVENMLTGGGRILVKEAPLPHARPVTPEADLRVEPLPSGFELLLLEDEDRSLGYGWTEIEYDGGPVERARALHAWQQGKRPTTRSHGIPKFLSNTWGDRSRDSRIQHDFIQKEIDAAHRLGVEILQIDDGWQKGVTANSAQAKQKHGIWEGYWSRDSDFWEPNRERFPGGLEPVVEKARTVGMGMGLWFSPDSSNEFANWQKDAQCILGLHRSLGIHHFKIDGVRAESARAQQNLRRFFQAVETESRGEVVFDLDITAQVRPGHFGAIPVGPLFVENRYTDWHNYWPHQTLRNLWKLSRWIDPRRLRMEFLNNSRNLERYPGDPLAPHHYDPSCLFATVMFSNPLGWFEVSNLPDTYFDQVPPLVQTWKEHREALFAGTVLPIGSAPDGISWTGLLSLAPGGEAGYILVFRELSPDSACMLDLPGVGKAARECESLSGSGEMTIQEGNVCADIPDKLGFLFARFHRA